MAAEESSGEHLGNAGAPGDGGPGQAVDEENRRWLASLGGTGRTREDALSRLHDLLLRVARAELRRRQQRWTITGPELDDLAHQAAADALIAIVAKLTQFRGESRFTTWAYRFVVLEVSSKLGRHFWQRPTVALAGEDWDRLPDRFGIDPDDYAQRLELLGVLRRAVDEELSDHQRHVFVALVVEGIPLDALVVKLGSNRNALYKTMFDARRKLRSALVANGYLSTPQEGAGTREDLPNREATMRGWDELDRFLRTDPADVGCDQALHLLHVYADLLRDDATGAEAVRRYPGVAAHLLACGPCAEDLEGLLLAARAIGGGDDLG